MKRYWSEARYQQFQRAIVSAKRRGVRPYAVFDADNTIWKHDLIEGLLARLSAKAAISIADIDSSLFPYPCRIGETIVSYYDYLCSIDHSLAYLWSSQVFAGYRLGGLQEEIKALFHSSGRICPPMPNDQHREVSVPEIFPAQKELISYLQEEGVQVWVVSASLEEAVRFVCSDPEYGLNIPPEQVIGVNLMLQTSDGGRNVAALERRAGKIGVEYYFSADRMNWVLGSYPFAPLTWYGGKVAAILEWITPSDRPILVAGDSPNDFYMQFYADVENDGIRLRIDRDQRHSVALENEKSRREQGNANSSPQEGWIEVNASQLGLP